MKKTIIMTFAAVAMAFSSCGGNKNAQAQTTDSVKQVEVNEPENDGGVLKSATGMPMLADFSAEWCPPCRQMKPIFHKLQEEYKGKVELITVDVDEKPELAQRYNVSSIPTLVYISPEGKELYRTVGFQTEAIIRADITKYLTEE